ncbi:alpha/beta hydrolase [Halioxenophilus sp. WMMB6]|uniref:alpha/beta hydrolase n=1 Tax=Halioxenophilus sp. WMMB6 TaxID=3073815 RepID=UPI00295E62DD|nr:alpha/beta fold hydrolase [Halioxenophilus sp. WMMB6]
MDSNYLSAIEIETAQPVTATVIWLHGLGASGDDFVPVVPELKLPGAMGVRFIFPHAPELPVTINGGMRMPAWYDILSMSLQREVDTFQLRCSAAEVMKLIEREIERGIASERIVLAGFSQGGAVVLEAALSYTRPLAGLLVLSSYFATVDSVQLKDANVQIPIFIGHGHHDPVVPEVLGQSAVARLQAWNYPVEYKTYPIDHSVCLPEIADISAWLQRVLATELQPG